VERAPPRADRQVGRRYRSGTTYPTQDGRHDRYDNPDDQGQEGRQALHRHQGQREDHPRACSSLFAKGCKVKVTYKKSHKKPGTVLLINRKVGEKLVVRALVKVRVAKKF
jgi:hypothetical protein